MKSPTNSQHKEKDDHDKLLTEKKVEGMKQRLISNTDYHTDDENPAAKPPEYNSSEVE